MANIKKEVYLQNIKGLRARVAELNSFNGQIVNNEAATLLEELNNYTEFEIAKKLKLALVELEKQLKEFYYSITEARRELEAATKENMSTDEKIAECLAALNMLEAQGLDVAATVKRTQLDQLRAQQAAEREAARQAEEAAASYDDEEGEEVDYIEEDEEEPAAEPEQEQQQEQLSAAQIIAAAAKEIKSTRSLQDLKKAYRKLALVYHPDKHQHAEAHNIFVAIKNEYDRQFKAIQNGTEDKREQAANIDDGFKEIIDQLIKYDNLVIKIHGSWLWIPTSEHTYKIKDEIKALGFRYKHSTKEWYWFDGIEEAGKRKGRNLTADQRAAEFGETIFKTDGQLKIG